MDVSQTKKNLREPPSGVLLSHTLPRGNLLQEITSRAQRGYQVHGGAATWARESTPYEVERPMEGYMRRSASATL